MNEQSPANGQPNPARGQTILFIALAVSLAVTVVLTVVILRRPTPQSPGMAKPGLSAPATQPLRGGVISDQTLDPPALYTLPPFTLTERSGAAVGLDEMRGKVWVADFIFTQCHGPCPALTSQMYLLQQRIVGTPEIAVRKDLQLVSLSVDPENDTPAVLTQYAGFAHALPGRWLFLTGSRAKVWALIKDGFKLPVAEDDTNPQMPILHSQRVALIDRLGRVRGYYDALTEEGRAALWADLGKVLAEAP
ncbi:MAG: SCO family protein [Planctomycetes bacterium]|nr:SCO family protein [Planctomycetota bacterium]